MSLALKAGVAHESPGHAIDRYIPAGHRFSLPDLWDMAEALRSSGLFNGISKTESAYALMLLCEADGLHPIEAMRRFHLINNRPAMRTDAMLAEMKRRGWKVKWHEVTARRAEATFYHATDDPEGTTFSVEFDQFGHLNKKDTWRNHPDDMLVARLISKACRRLEPSVIVGIYSPDEAEEIAERERGQSLPPAPSPRPRVLDVTARSAALPADVEVLGQRSPGHDPRPYHQVAKDAAAEANRLFAEAARERGVEGVKEPFTAAQVHGQILRLAISGGLCEKPASSKSAEVLRVLSEVVYAGHREWARGAVDEFVRGQLDGAIKALDGDQAADAPEPEAESQEVAEGSEAAPAREPGEDG